MRSLALHREDQQLPADRPLAGWVLVVVLRRQRVPLGYANLVAAGGAAVDAGVGGGSAGWVQPVEFLMLRLGQILTMLVLSQDGSFRVRSCREQTAIGNPN